MKKIKYIPVPLKWKMAALELAAGSYIRVTDNKDAQKLYAALERLNKKPILSKLHGELRVYCDSNLGDRGY